MLNSFVGRILINRCIVGLLMLGEYHELWSVKLVHVIDQRNQMKTRCLNSGVKYSSAEYRKNTKVGPVRVWLDITQAKLPRPLLDLNPNPPLNQSIYCNCDLNNEPITKMIMGLYKRMWKFRSIKGHYNV